METELAPHPLWVQVQEIAAQLETIGMVPPVINAIMLAPLVPEELTLNAQHALRISSPSPPLRPLVFQLALLVGSVGTELVPSATSAAIIAKSVLHSATHVRLAIRCSQTAKHARRTA